MASDRRMTSSSLSQRTTAWSTPCCSVFSPSQPFRPQKDLQDHVAGEASSLSTMYHSADGYPEPLRSQLKSELRLHALCDRERLAGPSAGAHATRGRASVASDP